MAEVRPFNQGRLQPKLQGKQAENGFSPFFHLWGCKMKDKVKEKESAEMLALRFVSIIQKNLKKSKNRTSPDNDKQKSNSKSS